MSGTGSACSGSARFILKTNSKHHLYVKPEYQTEHGNDQETTERSAFFGKERQREGASLGRGRTETEQSKNSTASVGLRDYSYNKGKRIVEAERQR